MEGKKRALIFGGSGLEVSCYLRDSLIIGDLGFYVLSHVMGF
jgi:hypothetical protein